MSITDPSQDVGKVYGKCCFGVGKVYIDENDSGNGRVVSFVVGLIAMSILGISFWWHRPRKDRVAMQVAALFVGVLPSSSQVSILEQTGRGQMCHNLAHGDLLGYGVLDMGMGCVVWSATGAVHSLWGCGVVVMGAIGAGPLPYSPTLCVKLVVL